jgi:membrane-bound serine protease (ClpP class)
MDLWIWAVVLLAVGLSLAVLEVFLPSGGLIGFLAGCTLVAAIVIAFKEGSAVGLAVLSTALVGIPIVVTVALQLWPKTALGRRMLLVVPESDDVLPDSPRQRFVKGLVGRVGLAKTKMLPAGAVTIDGRTIDAVSEGSPIEIGQRVRVLEVRANRVVVRPVTDETPLENAADPLARPIDTITTDPFGEHPA